MIPLNHPGSPKALAVCVFPSHDTNPLHTSHKMSWGPTFLRSLGCPSVMGHQQSEEWSEWGFQGSPGAFHLQVTFLPQHPIPSRPSYISQWLWGQARFWKPLRSNLSSDPTGKKKIETQLIWPPLRWGEPGQAARGRCPVLSTSSRSINAWQVALPFSVCNTQLLTQLTLPQALWSWCVPLPLSSELRGSERVHHLNVHVCLWQGHSSDLLPQPSHPKHGALIFPLWTDVKHLM